MPNMSLEKVKMPEQEPQIRNQNFKEVALGYTKEQAMEEATRCLNCKHSPCKNGCPVGVPIPEFIAEVAKGNFEEAYDIITQENALRLFVDVSVLKKINVKGNVFVASKENQ